MLKEIAFQSIKDSLDGKPVSHLSPLTSLKPIWQWNHNPDDSKWSLKNGRLRFQSMPAEQLMWARNTLTQRVIGPQSLTTVELYTKGMKDGDVAGLGNINVPCSWIGIVKDGKSLSFR